MARPSRIATFDRDIELLVADTISTDARQKQLVAFAQEELAAAQRRNQAVLGRVPEHVTIVDGVRGAPVEVVKSDGTVVYEFRLIETALAQIAAMLFKASPVKSGRFRASTILFADGTETDVNNPAPATEYAFVNAQPYARKIERGLSPQAPEGVFHGVAVLASRRYGNMAKISFGYRSLPDDAVGAWAQTPKAKALARRVRGGNPARHEDWLTRQPAVIIRTGT